MKVVHIINSLGVGGAEKLLLDTIPKYNAKGLTTDVLVFKSNNELFLNQLKELNCCKVIELKLKSVYNPLAIFRLIKYIKQYNIAHVHLFPALYFVPIAKLISFSKTKLVYTEHNTTNGRISHRILKYFDKYIYYFYFKLICISDEILDIMSNYISIIKNKMLIINNGVDLSNVKSGKPKNIHPSIAKNDKLLIQVSGFREQKDQKTLIKSLEYLPKNVKLILVGDGITKQSCIELTEQLKLSDRVFFLGNRPDIPDLLKSSDIVVLSSKFEGLSLSSIEAMASGRPFVASDVPGLRDLVKDTGILFEQGDSKALANSIKKLLDDKSHYEGIVESCQEKAKEYDISFMVEKHIKLYHEILN